jgi:hypothetical protein
VLGEIAAIEGGRRLGEALPDLGVVRGPVRGGERQGEQGCEQQDELPAGFFKTGSRG